MLMDESIQRMRSVDRKSGCNIEPVPSGETHYNVSAFGAIKLFYNESNIHHSPFCRNDCPLHISAVFLSCFGPGKEDGIVPYGYLSGRRGI
jgi:hypothetical protein